MSWCPHSGTSKVIIEFFIISGMFFPSSNVSFPKSCLYALFLFVFNQSKIYSLARLWMPVYFWINWQICLALSGQFPGRIRGWVYWFDWGSSSFKTLFWNIRLYNFVHTIMNSTQKAFLKTQNNLLEKIKILATRTSKLALCNKKVNIKINNKSNY